MQLAWAERCLAFCLRGRGGECFLVPRLLPGELHVCQVAGGGLLQKIQLSHLLQPQEHAVELFWLESADSACLAMLTNLGRICTWSVCGRGNQFVCQGFLKTRLSLGLVSPLSGLPDFAGLVGTASSGSCVMVVLGRRRKRMVVDFKLTQKPKTSFSSLCVCPGAPVVALGCADGSLWVFHFKPDLPEDGDNGDNGEEVGETTIKCVGMAIGKHGLDSELVSIAWNSAGHQLITTNGLGQCLVWQYEQTKGVLSVLCKLKESGRCASFHSAFPSSCFLMRSNSRGGETLSWMDLETGDVLRSEVLTTVHEGKNIFALVPLPPTQSKPRPPPFATAPSPSSSSSSSHPTTKRVSLSSLLLFGNRTPKSPEQMVISAPVPPPRRSSITSKPSPQENEMSQAGFYNTLASGLIIVCQTGEVFQWEPALPVVGFQSILHCFEVAGGREDNGCLHFVEHAFSPLTSTKRTAMPNLNSLQRIKTTEYNSVVCGESGVFILNQLVQQDFEPNALDALVLSPSQTAFVLPNKYIKIKHFDRPRNEIALSHQVKRMFALGREEEEGEEDVVFVCQDQQGEFVCRIPQISWETQGLVFWHDFRLLPKERVLDGAVLFGRKGLGLQTTRRLVLFNADMVVVNEHWDDRLVSLVSMVDGDGMLFTTRTSPCQVCCIRVGETYKPYCSLNDGNGGGPWQILRALPESLILARKQRDGSVEWLCRPLMQTPLSTLPARFATTTRLAQKDSLVIKAENPEHSNVQSRAGEVLQDLFYSHRWWDLYRQCIIHADQRESKQWLVKVQLLLIKNQPEHPLLQAIHISLGDDTTMFLTGSDALLPSLSSSSLAAANHASMRSQTLEPIVQRSSPLVARNGYVPPSKRHLPLSDDHGLVGIEFPPSSSTSNDDNNKLLDWKQNPCFTIKHFYEWLGTSAPQPIPGAEWKMNMVQEHHKTGEEFVPIVVKDLTLGLGSFQSDENACVGYWRFEEEEGNGTTLDLSRFNNHAKLFGEYSLRDDAETCLGLQVGGQRAPHSLLLEHGEGWMQIPIKESLDLARSFDQESFRQCFTFECWTKLFTTRDSVVLAQRTRGEWSLRLEGQQQLIFTKLKRVWRVRGNHLLEVNAWMHVALTCSLAMAPHIYLNGMELVLEEDESEQQVMVGEGSGSGEEEDVLKFGKGLNGELLEIRFWALERQEWEIRQGMETHLALADKKLVITPVPTTTTSTVKRKLILKEENDEDAEEAPQFAMLFKPAGESFSPKQYPQPPTSPLQDPFSSDLSEDGGNDNNDDDWKSVLDPASQSKYYYNAKTSERVWTNPRGRKNQTSPWDKILDEASGNHYYYNRLTGSTTWDVNDTDW
ncbi:hypothetical protein BASA81_003809 [Batrachochytrium salamandrivorans]|nr:hypothetical protein BASA81_003809 [Batrachochytrium salamandrivorans]